MKIITVAFRYTFTAYTRDLVDTSSADEYRSTISNRRFMTYLC